MARPDHRFVIRKRIRVMGGPLRATFAALLLAAVVAASIMSPGPTTAFAVQRLGAAALPQDRLHFGLANDPEHLDWMTSSGVPWRYRYQYLAGGVNTASGWETWNSPAGAFASLYMNASGANGYTPVFSYYELLQSKPSTGGNESDRDFSNLNNPSTMAAYYANFKLLMQEVGAYSRPVVVHVEPDLWGYLEQRAGAGDASSVSASVASTGFADVAALPNTAQGFAYALLKLRDLYGPNAVLSIHASPWGSGIDIASDTDPAVNPAAEADRTAAFLNSAGISSNPFGSTWDLVFNDLDDHDAGWWEQQGADNQYFTHWWDPANQRFPNFTRYLAWVAELKAKTARPQVAWQVPVGNQYFLTMNNTCGHYQDNVAAYFISHANDLFASGLIAVLFGAGNACQTSYWDAEADGVTNNGGVPTTDSLGQCNACNSHTSAWADDDGGFLRTFVGLYYTTAWTSLGGAAASGPAITSWSTGRLDVFVRSTNGALMHDVWTGGQWSGWEDLGGVLTSDPSAVSWGPNRIDVFVRGTDNAMYHRWWDGSRWQGWEGLGGVLTSAPEVSSWSSNRLDVFVRGTDNGLYHRWWDGARWNGWEGQGGSLTSAPGAVSWGPDRIDVFVRGTGDGLYHKVWYGGGWSSWEGLGGSLQSSPEAASCEAGHLDVFAGRSGGALQRLGYNGSTWGAWQSLSGNSSDDPGAVCPSGTGVVQVVERDPSGPVMQLPIIGT